MYLRQNCLKRLILPQIEESEWERAKIWHFSLKGDEIMV